MGRSGGLHGHGTYFAKHSSYSRNGYAAPDPVTGHKHIIVAAVCVGEMCQTSGGVTMGTPLSGSPIPGDLADTSVDVMDRENAQVFCCFEEQALSQFLITFTD
jgi:hypothetical protein